MHSDLYMLLDCVEPALQLSTENEIAGIVLALASDAGRWILLSHHGLHTFVSV